jgi:hypothetical protein
MIPAMHVSLLFTTIYGLLHASPEASRFTHGKDFQVDRLPEKKFTKRLEGAIEMQDEATELSFDSRQEILRAQRCSPVSYASMICVSWY